MSDDDDYDVGYKKPPKHTRWRKGESGRNRPRNPATGSRTPRVPRTLHDVVREVGAQTTTLREGDKVREVRISDLAVEKAIKRAIVSNNSRQIEYVIKLLNEAGAFGDREMTHEENVSDFLQNATAAEMDAVHHIHRVLGKYRPNDGDTAADGSLEVDEEEDG
jgi:hypothetical protein